MPNFSPTYEKLVDATGIALTRQSTSKRRAPRRTTTTKWTTRLHQCRLPVVLRGPRVTAAHAASANDCTLTRWLVHHLGRVARRSMVLMGTTTSFIRATRRCQSRSRRPRTTASLLRQHLTRSTLQDARLRASRSHRLCSSWTPSRDFNHPSSGSSGSRQRRRTLCLWLGVDMSAHSRGVCLYPSGAFSCSFTNRPTRVEVETHLQAQGYHVVATEQRDQVLQVYFCAHQLGTDTFFLCEFVLLFARRFFQATFKCQVRLHSS